MALLDAARRGSNALLIAPTGAGKTLAGFLPSLVDLSQAAGRGLHTLYVSPLKALTADIARNLEAPVQELGLALRIETRTGDTPGAQRARQREAPPDILLTTPESLALLLTLPDCTRLFAGLAAVVLDEIHALAGSKRGDQLSLCLARLSRLAPDARRIGLSATVAHTAPLAAFLSRHGRADADDVAIVRAPSGADPRVSITLPEGGLPWGGHMALIAAPDLLRLIDAHAMTIVFVNTRAQAELVFAALWRINAKSLPIGLHHGSLAQEQRRRIEAAMAAGSLRAVVATSSLDLGIDWAGVDLVVQVGAPKGVARLMQRLGRANHRWDEPSKAVLVPANRFEVLECEAAIAGISAGDLDGDPPRPGGLDVLAQHVMGVACAAKFHPDLLFEEVRRAAPYAGLSRRDFDDVVRFCEDGGYALAAYERYRRLFRDAEGFLHVANERTARQHRMNIGTIVEQPLLKVKLGRGVAGQYLGEVEEYFASMLVPGDSFMFAGRLLRFTAIRETTVECMPAAAGAEPKVPVYGGGRMPLSTYLADRVRGMLDDSAQWDGFPPEVREWLRLQKRHSRLPGRSNLLVETFPRGGRWFLVAYCFEGRNAHQTLGMLLTRRMERAGFGPLGYVATDYVLAAWCAHQPHHVADLFEEDMLGDDLEAWMAESSMLRRTFRNVAVISGLTPRHTPGAAEKNRRQLSVNTDLIYDVLNKHDPTHILLRATRADAAAGLIDLARIAVMLKRVKNRVVHMALSKVSPLAVPVLLEIGHERVAGGAGEEALLAEAEEEALIAEAIGDAPTPAAAATFRSARHESAARRRSPARQRQLL
ncbi:MAG: ligase-associated DNA damage response DEXH box helicase [Acetobacteraceae bacterium]|nr:ligase-associated DNA damage response DEXH box helicase [Acetobacteraceae bacterium]